ncbi:MBOAT family protein [Geobacter sp. AOG2]|uniref:MBOAT family O-acyltransferase n=1 Tax=Geobacter sp. AOG2 TaxID=1566347 RepID=UPI001CC5E99C|nr:MBOAT family O-acyltransferase [Geobacter sp. AOG2]GFE60485.1 alginate O-acetyltransferase [Geobacter sp. AOG2]
MPFNSLVYFLFLPATYLLFFVTVDRWRWLVLLGTSYGFYAALKAPYLLAVLLTVTGISYVCGLRIAASQDETIRKRWLWAGTFACVAVLAVLKYFPFIESYANSIFGLNATLSRTLISIGVSYYAFQAISYLADIYLEIEEPEQHFGHYALFMAFFPKLLQGPLERAGDLLPQLKRPYRFDYDAMRSGMFLFTWGLFKKVVVADRLSLIVDTVYNDVHSFTGFSFIFATYLYAMQIYFDFSGYTDMALGTARMFNINLSQNFNSPYMANSVADFWRRWHISFSRWILDYIFKPLQMRWRDWKTWGTASALMVTFFISGIWHGASWGFVVWGLLHGAYLATSVFYKPLQKKIHKKTGLEKTAVLKIWQTIATFNLVCFAWIFFRANSLSDALYIIRHLFSGFDSNITSALLTSGKISLLILLCSLGIVNLSYIFIRFSDVKTKFYDKPLWFRWSIYYGLVVLLLVCNIDIDSMFVYFKF